jgi:hypothetical protein
MFSKTLRLLIASICLIGVGSVFAAPINLAQCSCGGAGDITHQSQLKV